MVILVRSAPAADYAAQIFGNIAEARHQTHEIQNPPEEHEGDDAAQNRASALKEAIKKRPFRTPGPIFYFFELFLDLDELLNLWILFLSHSDYHNIRNDTCISIMIPGISIARSM